MSWKFVFNSGGMSCGSTKAHVAQKAIETGYKFFTFNGCVFFVSEKQFFDTHITVSDLY